MEFANNSAGTLHPMSALVSIPIRLGKTPVNMLVREGTQTGSAQ